MGSLMLLLWWGSRVLVRWVCWMWVGMLVGRGLRWVMFVGGGRVVLGFGCRLGARCRPSICRSGLKWWCMGLVRGGHWCLGGGRWLR